MIEESDKDLNIIELQLQLKSAIIVIEQLNSENENLKRQLVTRIRPAPQEEDRSQYLPPLSSSFNCDFCGASDDDGCNC